MAVFNEPQKWAQTLGKDADVTTIPDTAGDTDPSIDKIFPAVFSIPLANGGKAIPRSVLNGLFKLLGDWSFYQQNGGIASYSNTFDYAVGSFVKYNNKLYLCIQANGASSTVKAPTDAKYWQKIVIQSDIANFVTLNTAQTISAIKHFSVLPTTSVAPTDDAHLTNKWYVDTTIAQLVPTGTILAFGGVTIPSGWLLCNGASISRSTFSNLFAKIGTTYGKGNGSTTFNIPDLRDRYIIGANTKALGTYINEQLPNISGQLDTRMTIYGINPPSGVFSSSNQTSANSKNWSSNTTANDTNIYTILFRASSFNSVYTDSGNVYPKSLALNFIIKI